MRIAFVHEYLNQFGGAERMLASLSELYPDAPIYTLLYDEAATKGLFRDRTVRTSFLQSVPFAKTRHQWYPLLMPLAMEQFDFSQFDVVLSISASFAKGIITGPGTKHICYCLTPPRFLWDNSQQFVEEFGFPRVIKKAMLPFLSYVRVWDHHAARRVDEWWSISDFVSSRIEKYYRQPSRRFHPPVETEKFRIGEPKDYFLMVGRLVSYKKFDIAIRAFNRLGLTLIIAGTGPERSALQELAGPTVQLLGQVSDERLIELYAGARALIFPQEEDFGIVPLEAMASGRPVIAYAAGGALETVVAGKTGIFFSEQIPESLETAVREFDQATFDPAACRAQAEQFDVSIFKKNIQQALEIYP